MATRAELQKAVDGAQAAAIEKRSAWKASIPGGDAKMTTDEQKNVDNLEAVYFAAKSTRKEAERALAAWTPPVAAAAVDTISKWDKKWILHHAGPRGLTDKAWADTIAGPRPAGWQGY